jgi:hypothetical protein
VQRSPNLLKNLNESIKIVRDTLQRLKGEINYQFIAPMWQECFVSTI